jgi:hypothetical protein
MEPDKTTSIPVREPMAPRESIGVAPSPATVIEPTQIPNALPLDQVTPQAPANVTGQPVRVAQISETPAEALQVDSSLEAAATTTATEPASLSEQSIPVLPKKRTNKRVIAGIFIGSAIVVVLLAFLLLKSKGPGLSTATETTPDQTVSLSSKPASSNISVLGVGTTNQLLINADVVTSGSLYMKRGGFYGQINTTDLTANQKYLLPNSSGTVCLDTNNCGFALSGSAITTSIAGVSGAITLGGSLSMQGNTLVGAVATTTSVNNFSGSISIQGTTNQINVSSSGNVISLSTPQDIATTSAPTFAGITLTAAGTQNGFELCDISNNCGYSGGGGLAFIQNGNSFGTTATLGTNDNHDLALETNGIARVTITNAGDVNVANDLTVSSQLAVGSTATVSSGIIATFSDTYTGTSGLQVGVGNFINLNPGADSSASNVGIYNSISTQAGNNRHFTGYNYGANNTFTHNGIGAVDFGFGNTGAVVNASSGNIAIGYGTSGVVVNSSSGNVTFLAAGLEGQVLNTGSGNIASATALFAVSAVNSGGGTITNNSGIYVQAQTVGVNDYGIEVEAADTQTLWLSSNANNTTASAGIAFGSSRDTNLYRGAADQLNTDDSVDVAGHIAIGSNASVATDTVVRVSEISTSTSGGAKGISTDLYLNAASNSSVSAAGTESNVTLQGLGINYTGLVVGSTAGLNNDSTGTVNNAAGNFGFVNNRGAGTLTGVMGSGGVVLNSAGGTITTAAGLQSGIFNSSTGTISTAMGLLITSTQNGSGGIVTTNYGIKVDSQIAGISDYGIRVDAADTQTLWLSGNADNTAASAGIAFGTSRDTNLYRSATDTLRTDDKFSIGALGTTDTAAYLCLNSANILAACSGTASGSAFVQGGNSFGATALLGTTDNNDLAFEVNNTLVCNIDSTELTFSCPGAGSYSEHFGFQSGAIGDQALAVGVNTQADGDYSVALGVDAISEGTQSVAIGIDSFASGANSVAVGQSSSAEGDNSVMVGSGYSLGTGSIAIGHNSEADDDHDVALGDSSLANGGNTIAIGYQAVTQSDSSIAIGSQALADDINAIAFGADASAGIESSIAIGRGATTQVTFGAIAIGDGATAGGSFFAGTAIGMGTSATGNFSTALGYGSQATGDSSTALGSAVASATGSVAIGFGSSSTHDSSIALGVGATSTAANQLVIGSAGSAITDVYIGSGVTDAAPMSFTFNATGGSAAGTAGATLTLKGGAGATITTGSAGGGLMLQGGDAGGSGNNNGGNVTINGGNKTGSGSTGTISIGTTTASAITIGHSLALVDIETNGGTINSSGPLSLSAGNLNLNTSGFGNTDIGNGAGAITIAGHLIPSVDDTYDLGSATNRWRDLYLGPASLHIGTSGNDYGISYDTATSALQLNSGLADRDIKISGDTQANLLYVDAGNDRIGIGTATPGYNLEVNGTFNATTSLAVGGVAVCTATGCTADPTTGFRQGGNAFGTAAVLGTTDNNSLTLQTGTGALNLGTNASAHATTVGSTTGASSLTLNAGSGNATVNSGFTDFVGNIELGAANTTGPGLCSSILGNFNCNTNIDAYELFTNPTGSTYGIYNQTVMSVTSAANTVGNVGNQNNLLLTGNQNFTGSSPSTANTAISGDVLVITSGSVTDVRGVQGSVSNAGATVTAASALYGILNTNSGTIATGYGLQVASAVTSGSGAITSNYGIMVKAQTGGASDYGIAVEAADTQTLWLSSNADNTTAAAGIAFGSSRDTNLYRSAANTLKSDSAAVFQNTSNSTSAFQVKNAAGTANLINVDNTGNASNIVTNGSFETNTTGWAAKGSGGSISQITSQHYIGSGAMQVVTGVSANAGASFNVSLSAGSFYTITFMVKSSSGTISTLNVGRVNSGSDTDCTTAQSALAGGWTQISCSFTSSAGDTSIYIKDTSTSHTLYVDAVTLILNSIGNVAPYREGNIGFDGTINTPLVVQSAADSTNAFQVVNSAGTYSYLKVDTLNGGLTLGGGAASGTGAITLQTGGGGVNIGANAVAQIITIGNSTGSTALTLDAGTGAINIGTNAIAHTITLGNSTGATSVVLNSGTGAINIGTNAIAHTITLGNSTGATSVVLNSGTGAINIGTNAIAHTVSIGNQTGASAVTIDSGTGAINIGAAIAKTISIGNVTGATALNLTAGTGGLALTTQGTGALAIGNNSVAQTINIGNSTGTTGIQASCGTGTCGFGNNGADHTTSLGSNNGASQTLVNAGTSGLSLGNSAVANTIQIGNTSGAVAQTINIGNNATASSVGTLVLGSTIGASISTLQAGTGGLNIQTQGTGTLGIGNNAVAQTLQIGNSTGATTVTIDSGTGTIGIGTTASARTVNVATGAAAQTATFGSINTTSTTTIQAGTGGLNLGSGGIANTIQIGNTTGAVAQTINIGNNSTASSTNNINLGSSIAGTVALTGPTTVTNRTSGSSDTFVVSNSTSTGTILLAKDNTTTVLTVADGGAATFQNSSNSSTAFNVNNSSSESVFAADTSSNQVFVGNGPANGAALNVRSNSTAALNIYNTLGGNVLVADGTNKTVGIGKVASTTITLDVLSGGADATTVAQFKNAGATSCTVQPGGTGFACSSDARLKTNISDIGNGLDVVNQLRAVNFNWNSDPNGKSQVGFLAQDLQNIIPSAVSTDSNGYLVANYSMITPYLVGAVQLQQGQINQLSTQTGANTSQNTSLSSRVTSLEQQVAQLSAQQGQGSNFTDLNVSGTATITNLKVTGAATIAQLTVTGSASIGGNLTIGGHILGNSDTRGTLTIPAGQTQAKFTFVHPYGASPNVIVSPKNTFAPSYRVDSTATEFTIYFESPASTDVIMNYQVQE